MTEYRKAIGKRPDLNTLLPELPIFPDNIVGDPNTGEVELVYTNRPSDQDVVAINRVVNDIIGGKEILRTFMQRASGSSTNVERDDVLKLIIRYQQRKLSE